MSLFNFKRLHGNRDIKVNARFSYQVAFNRVHGGQIELMDNFCSVRFIPHRTRTDMRGHLRYCFAYLDFADTFSEVFGGVRIDVATRDAPDALVKTYYPSEGEIK
jgi:hypothetical protein